MRHRYLALEKQLGTGGYTKARFNHIRLEYKHSNVHQEMSHLVSVMTQLQCSFINGKFGDFMGQCSAGHFQLGTDWSPKGACTHEHTVLGCLHTRT